MSIILNIDEKENENLEKFSLACDILIQVYQNPKTEYSFKRDNLKTLNSYLKLSSGTSLRDNH